MTVEEINGELTNFGKLQLFDLGRQMKKKYGKQVFIKNNHTIISNFTRCMKSFKFFLLGILSDSNEIIITSHNTTEFDRVNNKKNNDILQSIDNLFEKIKNKLETDPKNHLNSGITFSLNNFTKFKNEILLNQKLKKKKLLFKKQKLKNERPHLKCNEKGVIKICKEINVSHKSFSLEIPKKKQDYIFHPVKQME